MISMSWRNFWRSGLGGWSTAASVADLRSPVLLGWKVVPQRRVPRPSWRRGVNTRPLDIAWWSALEDDLENDLEWLGEVLRLENVMKMTFHWKMIFKGSMWVYRKVIWSHMVMGPIWRQSQASSEWPIDVWEPPSLIHFWRANIHGKCRWDILGYIFCDAAYSKIFQEYSQQCSQFYSGEVIIQRNSTEMNIQLLFQLLLPS